MGCVSIDLFKKHTRTDDFDSDDDLLRHYLEAAEDHVVSATRRAPNELLEMGNGFSYPAPLTQAIMMLAAHWYNQRESSAGTQFHQVPYALDSLILPYRKLV